MADTLDVISLSEGKSAINTPSTAGTTFDNEMAAFITAVSRRLDTLVGPVVNRTVTSERADGGSHYIILKKRPVFSVTTVTEYVSTTGTAIVAEGDSSKTGYDYLLDATPGILYRRSSGSDALWARGRKNVVITYVAGRYADTTTVDQKYKIAAGIMLANLWHREQGQVTVEAPLFGPGTNFPTFAVPNAVIELLADEIQVDI